MCVSVVTGSTHGIGKAYAQELASAGVNIVIISLGQRDCEQVAKEIGIGYLYETGDPPPASLGVLHLPHLSLKDGAQSSPIFASSMALLSNNKTIITKFFKVITF